jgi:DNA modification methylase
MKISEIHLNPDNPRFIKDDKFEKLKKNIKEFPKMMKLRPIVIDDSGKILGGNMRYRALIELGYQEIPKGWVVKASELTEEEKKRFIIADNIPYGEFDYEKLGNEWDEVKLEDWGMDLSEINIHFEPEAEEDDFDVDKEVEETKEPICELGDIWQLGNHRIMCGDSTKKEDVEKLMDGKKADICFTSPPYFNQRPEYSIFESYDDYNIFLSKIIDNIINFANKNKFVLAWNIGDNQPDCLPMIADQTVLIHKKKLIYLDTIIWRKAGAVYSIPRSAHIRQNNFYYPALCWEPVIIFRIGNMPKFDKRDVEKVSSWHQNVWDISQVIGSQQKKIGHPAIFPVELAYRVLLSYSQNKNITIEPFLGSGSTLIACEQTNRICYGMEIDPIYCDVTIKRWEQYTKQKAEKLNA